MKKEEFYELLGELDAGKIKAAEKPPVRPLKRNRIGIAAACAACLALILTAGIALHHRNAKPSVSSAADMSSEDASDVESKDVEIYYLSGGEIRHESEFLPCVPKNIFASWKKKNGIGDEVELLGVKIEDNGSDAVSPDSSVAAHTTGDKFVLHVRVSENLKSYYAKIPEEMLLESLKLTMTGYSEIAFDGYDLILE